MEQTAAALRELGVKVDIRLADDRAIAYHRYDLLHAFNITRPADILFHARKSHLPLIVSPIYLEHGTASNTAYNPALKWLMDRIGPQRGEYLKTIGRAVLKNETIRSAHYLLWGQRKSISRILENCAMLLPNSESEYQRLKRDFAHAGAYSVVPNSVDTRLFKACPNSKKDEKSVLCAARFEPRKNQLNVIQALNMTDFQITFVGQPAPSHQAYYEKCKALAGPNVRFLNFVSQEQLSALYKASKVHILASWFETTGLSSLEAAASGCNIVISDLGDTRDYFGAEAYYCSPDDHQSIRDAVKAASIAPPNEALSRHIHDACNWQKTAKKTLNAYKTILHHENSDTGKPGHT